MRAIKQATEATRCQSLDILEPAGRAAGQATDLHSVEEGHSDSPRYHGTPLPTHRLKHQPIASDTSSSAGTPTPVLGDCAVRSVSSAYRSYGKSADLSVRINPVIPTHGAEGTAPQRGRAQLIRRVYEADALLCTCGAQMRILSFVTDPKVARKIRDHLQSTTTDPAREPPPVNAESAELGAIVS